MLAWSIQYFPTVWGNPFKAKHTWMMIANLSIFTQGILSGLLYLAILIQIFRLLGFLSRNDPFHEGNPGRIRRIAFATFGIAAVDVVLSLVRMYASRGFSFQGIWRGAATALLHGAQTALGGAAILVIAAVLEAGVKLQREKNLTV
jgi:hypothetical protein